MITTEKELLEFLDQSGFQYEKVDHEPVFTCEEAEQKRPNLPGVSMKNLFLCDKKGRRFFLVVTECQKDLDLSHLAERFGVKKLRFASEKNLQRLLGVMRGAVTVLGLVNDTGHEVELWLDSSIWNEGSFLCHPLVNTSTLMLSRDSLNGFFNITKHVIHFFDD